MVLTGAGKEKLKNSQPLGDAQHGITVSEKIQNSAGGG